MQSARQRGGRPWRRAQDEVRSRQPNCHLCGYPIDLTLDRQRHPLGSSVDHLLPLSRAGVTYEPSLLAHAHRLCNGKRYSKPVTLQLKAECRAAVTALLSGDTSRMTPRRPQRRRTW